MEKLVVRVLDGATLSSGEEEGEGYTSRSEADSGRHARRLKLGGGRMKRTASAPVPPLLSMLSRTGKWLLSGGHAFVIGRHQNGYVAICHASHP